MTKFEVFVVVLFLVLVGTFAVNTFKPEEYKRKRCVIIHSGVTEVE